MIHFYLPTGGLVNLHIQLWSFPKSHTSVVSHVSLNVSALSPQMWLGLNILFPNATCQSAAIAQAPRGKQHSLFLALVTPIPLSRCPFICPSWIPFLLWVQMFAHIHHADTDLTRGNQTSAWSDKWYGNHAAKYSIKAQLRLISTHAQTLSRLTCVVGWYKPALCVIQMNHILY